MLYVRFGKHRRCPQRYRTLIMPRLFGRKRTEPRRRGVLRISRDTLTRTSPCEVESPPTSALPRAATSFALAADNSQDCPLNASRHCDSNSVFERVIRNSHASSNCCRLKPLNFDEMLERAFFYCRRVLVVRNCGVLSWNKTDVPLSALTFLRGSNLILTMPAAAPFCFPKYW